MEAEKAKLRIQKQKAVLKSQVRCCDAVTAACLPVCVARMFVLQFETLRHHLPDQALKAIRQGVLQLNAETEKMVQQVRTRALSLDLRWLAFFIRCCPHAI